MVFLFYALLFTITGLLIYQFFWKKDHQRQNKEKIINQEKNVDIKDRQLKNQELIMDWEVAKELSINLKEEQRSSIEVIKPSIEFFESPDYPEMADYELESKFYENRIRALIRDPYWVFLYWEVHNLFDISASTILKVLDITGKDYPVESANYSFLVEIDLGAKNWYIKVPTANRTYTVELGLQGEQDFTLIARSNYFTTPRDKPSDKVDPEWMTLDEVFKRSYKHPKDRENASPFGEEQFAEQISSAELIRNE